MKKLHASLFINKEWSTSNVMLDTLLDLKKLSLNHSLLETLSDVDDINDLNASLKSVL